MSLEQALADNTAALLKLTALLEAANAQGAAFVAAATPEEKPKRTKATPVKVAAIRYFFNEKHDSVYRIAPEDPVQNPMEGSVEITQPEFEAHQARLATKYAHLSAEKPADTVTTEVKADPQPEVKPADLMARVVLLSQKADGRSHMEKILAEFGVPKFSLLPAQHLSKALDLVNKAIGE